MKRTIATMVLLVTSVSACGLNVGRGLITFETTGYREELNRGKFTQDLDTRVMENISESDRNKLSVRLAEAK